MARVERQLERVAEREAELHAALVEHATDHEKLAELDGPLREVQAQKEALEEEWLAAATVLE
jgi:ABC transport system ATP-binding/permease protein